MDGVKGHAHVEVLDVHDILRVRCGVGVRYRTNISVSNCGSCDCPVGLRTKVIHVGYLIQAGNLALQLLPDIFQVCTQVNTRVQLEARVPGQAAVLDGSRAMGQCNDSGEGRRRGIREEVLGHCPPGDSTGAKDEGHVILGLDHLENCFLCYTETVGSSQTRTRS